MGNRFISKGWGRIFVDEERHIPAVIEAIKAVDESELDYLGKNVIAVLGLNDQPKLVYTHKFEIDMDALTFYCWQRGIKIWCVSVHDGEFWTPEGK